MYTDKDSIRAFKRMHARDVMAMEAHHLDEDGDADTMTGHLQMHARENNIFSWALLVILGVAAIGGWFFFG